MALNIYEFLGYKDTKVSDSDVLMALQNEKTKWNNKRMQQPERAAAKLAIIEALEAELRANPNMLAEHKKMFSDIQKEKRKEQEKYLRDEASIFVINGEIEETSLKVLQKRNPSFTEEDILRILGARIKGGARPVLNDSENIIDRIIYNDIVEELGRVGKKDLYDFLGLPPTAKIDEIKQRNDEIFKDLYSRPIYCEEHNAIRNLTGKVQVWLLNDNKRVDYDKTLKYESSKPVVNKIDQISEKSLGVVALSGKIFGIDLGTTYSCIAYINEYGKLVTVPNCDNSPVTPSLVFFETPDSVSVGEVAKQALQSDPQLVCCNIKSQMGDTEYRFYANGQEYYPETVSSLILSKLAKDASERQGGEDVKDVVITCPAYFGIQEREATKNAGKLAGLNVLSIINEPTAAAIAFGLKVEEPQTVIVYDLGGATFNVTIINVANGVIRLIATGGDRHLGGKDWDAKIQKYAVDQYVQLSGSSEDEVYDDEIAMGDLLIKSEQAKKRLTSRESTSFRLMGQKIEISRQQFNDLTADLLRSTISMMRNTMDEATKKGINSYDKILLVGGSAFMPQVRALLESEFAGIPVGFSEPDEVVAHGAALYGANIQAFQDAIEWFAKDDEIIEANKR